MKNVLLLDGYNLIYRARHARMAMGEYSTVFNFFRSIRPLVEKFNPDVCYFVLEGRPKRRLEVSSDYKGQRVYHDDDNFNEQRRTIIRMINDYFPFVVARHNDYECDDVINYLANTVHTDDNVTIISSDTDFIQSINETTQVYSPIKKKFFDATEYDYVLWKALVGDKSDNIEGFRGIGDKTAVKILSSKDRFNEFMSVKENKEKFDKNCFMIRFHDMTPDLNGLELYVNESSLPHWDWQDVKNEFTNMGFSSIIGKEKSWNKYIKTFENLERNIQHVNWDRIRPKHSKATPS